MICYLMNLGGSDDDDDDDNDIEEIDEIGDFGKPCIRCLRQWPSEQEGKKKQVGLILI